MVLKSTLSMHLWCAAASGLRERNADAIAEMEKINHAVRRAHKHSHTPFVLAPGFMRECDCLAVFLLPTICAQIT
jgi:hypothetical protein